VAMRVKLSREHEDVLARAVEVSHSRGSLRTPAYAVNVLDIDRRLLSEEDLLGIAEVHTVFKPVQLKDLSRDASLQQEFEYRMNSYMRRIPSDQLVAAIPFLEGRQGYSLSSGDAAKYSAFVAELMANPRIDLICTPVFHRIAEELIPVFTEKFLEAMTTYSKSVALTIPYASRETRDRVVETYLRWADRNDRVLLNFLCVDYNGSNPISKYSFHNYALRYVRLLEREVGEPIVMYGVNVKYSRVAKKYDELPARDLVSYFAQLDIYGYNHKRRPIPGEVAERLRADEAVKKQKLLNRERYTYVSLDKIRKDSGLIHPEAGFVEQLLAETPRSVHRVERVVKLMNIRNTIKEAEVLRQIFSGEEYGSFKNPLQYLKSKEVMRIDNVLLQRLEKFTKLYRSRTRSLDEYLNE